MDISFEHFRSECPDCPLDSSIMKEIRNVIIEYSAFLGLKDIDKIDIICKKTDTTNPANIEPIRNERFYIMKLSRHILRDTMNLQHKIRHELYHIKDVKDPNFEYNENRYRNLYYEPLLKAVVNTLWDIYIDKRINENNDISDRIKDIIDTCNIGGYKKTEADVMAIFSPEDIQKKQFKFYELIELASKIINKQAFQP